MAADSQPHPVSPRSGGALLRVRVTPRAGRSGIAGVRDGSLLVRLAAPPVEGAANQALIAFLAERLALPKRAMTIVRGERARDKQIAIEGVAPEEVARRLGLTRD